jgi:hypothetical protein
MQTAFPGTQVCFLGKERAGSAGLSEISSLLAVMGFKETVPNFEMFAFPAPFPNVLGFGSHMHKTNIVQKAHHT